MTTNDYHFVDRWRVEGTLEEVADILEDALSLPRWWGSVYFEVKEIVSRISRGDLRGSYPRQVIEYINGRLEILKLDPRLAIGTWLDAEDGRTYLDIVVIVAERELAVSEGRKYNQIGIFDLRRKKLIRTGGTGTPMPKFVPFEQRLPPLVRGPGKEDDERI